MHRRELISFPPVHMLRFLFLICRRSVVLLLVPILVGAGCERTSDRVRLLKGVPTVPLRFEFSHTGAPVLLMQVPRGLNAESVPEAGHDMFYIYKPADTGSVQRGLVMLESQPHPATLISDSAMIGHSPGIVAGKAAEWRFGATESEGRTVYQRELHCSGLFAGGDNHNDVPLHAFVVGYDSLFLDTLMASVESLRFEPDTSSTR